MLLLPPGVAPRSVSTLSVDVADAPGVLLRVLGICQRRGARVVALTYHASRLELALEAELLARTLGTEIEDDDSENPSEAERKPFAPAQFDAATAIKVLQMRKAEAKARSDDRRGRIFVRVTQEETDAALEKKLAMVERRLAKRQQQG